ncbi:phosphatidylserine decarboxylase family protein [Flavobacterium sp. J49]|uniref:phosphatidylserine decarboxylase family protein n=1 Tax=Flavobacterium sp. J49 TaxID=2718534 RepID=UPI0015949B89|nr:phosphatidylserine decarboxylase family protein [Flavobacterium sp. J49]MBF6640062.1 phosphatidylserine decarboxylase family protein [Flavobacterium sp. J49]NIC01307.1 phosphatidylserine decarboxylase family protein [Flavobacterium sp. J49]
MFHKEGYKIIFIAILSFVAALLLTDKFVHIHWLKISIQLVFVFLFVMILQFFRNPNRKIVPNENYFLAPVDGKVVVIEEVFEEEYFKDKRVQVSIFMSPINVHVTRYGASGKIKFSKYHPGKYLVAWHPKASTENERTTVVIETKPFGEVLYRQIAGALARRIVNYAEEGQQVVQGDDAGFIKFGSRVDIYFPLGTKIEVALNQNAVGNQTVIASK